jgi:subtilase family serine protease
VLSSRRFLAALSTLLACACALPALAAAETVPVGEPTALPAGATAEGPIAPGRPLNLYVALESRDPAALQAYAEEVATPGSPVYGQYLSVAEFTQRFAPMPADVAKVRQSLEAQGLEVGATPANHLSLPVEATAAEAEAAFDTELERIQTADGEAGYISTDAPRVTAAAAPYVAGVLGLDEIGRPQRTEAPAATPNPLLAGGGAGTAAVEDPAAGPGPQPCKEAVEVQTGDAPRIGYTAEKFAKAYGFDKYYEAGNFGAGQTIALYEQEPFKMSDIDGFQACYGTHVPVEVVDVGTEIEPNQKEEGEAPLDVEQAIQLAPGAHVVVYRGGEVENAEAEILTKWVSENRAKVMSDSYGWCEEEYPEGKAGMAAVNQLLQEAAAQGQTFLSASGDTGSALCTQTKPKNTSLAVSYPTSDPFATGVGGTRLEEPTAPQPREYLWNDLPEWGAGGGGVSAHFPMPTYQSDAAPDVHVLGGYSSGATCGFAGYCRQVPDVSAAASVLSGYPVFVNGSWEVTGGTSAAAPLWAALATLVNASPACDGHPVGFLNPALYSIAGNDYAANFRDIVEGKPGLYQTTNRQDPGKPYPAGPGYDMATGLGTPLGAQLGASLCALANPVVPTPPAPPEPTPSAPSDKDKSAAKPAAPAPAPTPSARILGSPRLAGVAGGAPKLSFGIEARGGRKLETVTVSVPAGFTAAATKKALAAGVVARAGGKRLKVAVSVVGKAIQVRLLSPTAAVSLRIGSPALSVGDGLRERAKAGKAKQVGVVVTTGESGGLTSRFPLRLGL